MSNSLAIAAVTATLRNLLFRQLQIDMPDVEVTTMPPDKARPGNASNHQLNLFLFQVNHNPGLRNMDFPPHAKPGETGSPPLALRLAYLFTAYAPGDDDVESHKLLGKAMSVLHDHPVLGAEEIRDALSGNDLYLQVERVRLTPDQISLEDLSKLWTTFQTQYRVSTIYQASTVLIESTSPRRTPLPVLRPELSVQTSLIPPYPALDALVPPNQQASVRLGDTLTLTGSHLVGDSVEVLFSHPRWSAPVTRPAVTATPQRITVAIPDDPSGWPAGTYSVAALITNTGEAVRTTNALALTLAPRITGLSPNPAPRGPEEDITLTVDFSPEVRLDQRVTLLLGGREVPSPSRSTPVASLAFVIPNAPPGEHFVRLRVDGVDSLLIDRSVTPPVFDVSQQVIVT